jgi:hypothetical protein
VRLLLIGRNKEFSPDACQRLGSVYGLSPSGLPGWHLPHTVSHSAAVAESAPERIRHCSFSGGGDHCQAEPRRSGKNAQRKAQPQPNGSPTAQHRGLRSSPPMAEADCSAWEALFWFWLLCVLVGLYAFVKAAHV